MSKQQEALRLALEALELNDAPLNNETIDLWEQKTDAAITAIREALAEQPAQPKCNPHPKAPHGFDRNASHSADRYVCDCESWEPYDAGYQAGYEACLKREEALDALAENASELGLDYAPAQQQEPVAWINWCAATGKQSVSFECESELASQPLYEGITQNTQYHYSKFHSWFDSELHRQKYTKDHPAYLAAQEAWNASNDAAQHRINRLNAEIEAWKVRFKIAEDALAKLNGPEQKPVAWRTFDGEGGYDYRTYDMNENYADEWDKQNPKHKGWVEPLYTSPPASKPWVGLTDRENAVIRFALHRFMADAYAQMTAAAQDKDNRYFKPGAVDAFAKDAKDAESLLAKLREKNT